MTQFSLINRKSLSAVLGVFALSLAIGAINPASAACKNRGDLDVRFCDDDGDLVADTPTDKSKLLNPSTLIFSYTPVEDPDCSLNYR